MPTPPTIGTDILLDHARALRGLARGLLRDDDAEDVVQDTWVAALERPPADADRAGGWLHRVAERMARKRRRIESRRTARERAVAQGTEGASVDPVDDVLVRREMLRQVADAVLALEEPYQTAVLLRYYQDLAPPAIAKRLGVPVATVNSRLHRARVRLRERLDREWQDAGGARGQWALALATCTGWDDLVPAASGAAPGVVRPTLGVNAMAMTVISLSTAGGAAAILWATSSGATGPAPAGATQLAGAVQEVAPVTAVSSQHGQDAAGETGREPVVAPAVRSAPWAPSLEPGEHRFVLEGQVLDPKDMPVQGAEVFAAPPLQPLTFLGETDELGAFRFEWRGTEPAQSLVLTVRRLGFDDPGLRLVELRAGEASSLRLGVTWPVREHFEGLRLPLIELQRRVENGETGALEALEDAERSMKHTAQRRIGQRPVEPRFEALQSDTGEIRFRWPTTTWLEHDRRRMVGHLHAMEVAEQKRRFEEDRKRVTMELERDPVVVGSVQIVDDREGDAQEPGTTLMGIVRRADGGPAEGTGVLATSSTGTAVAVTGEDGSFRVEVHGSGPVQLHARGGELGQARTDVDIGRDAVEGVIEWHPTLDRGREVLGALSASAGGDVELWFVEALVGDAWNDTSLVRDGTFDIPNLDPGPVRLLVRPWGTPFAFHVFEGVEPGEQSLLLDANDLARGSMSLVVADSGGEPAEAEVRVWQDGTRRGTWMHRVADGDAYLLEDVPEGSYRVEVGTVESGFRDLGVFDVVAGESTELPAFTLDRPGGLTWSVDSPADEDLAWELSYRGAGAPTFVASGLLSEPFTDALAPGEYLLAVGGASLSVPALPVTVPAGATTTVELQLAARGEVTFAVAAGASTSAEPILLEIFDPDGGSTVWTGPLVPATGLRLALIAGSYHYRAGGSAGELRVESGRATIVELAPGSEAHR